MTSATFARILIAVSAVSTVACASKNAAIAVPTGECPVILLSRTGGLGFETLSGVVAAVWTSGTIVRSEAAAVAGPNHLIGRLAPTDVAALTEIAQSPSIWNSPRGDVVLDAPDDTLTVRRNGEIRQWSETPGFTTTPAVRQLRARLFELLVIDARRLDAPLDDVMECAAAK